MKCGLAVVAVVVAAVTACGSEHAGPTASVESPGLPEGDWELVDGTAPTGPLEPVDGHQVTLSLDGDQVSGTAACNGYGGRLTSNGETRIDQLSGTDMACHPQAVMELESAYLEALADVDRIELQGDMLVATGPSTELRFAELPPVPTEDVVGTAWVLESLVDGDTTTNAAGDTATLQLDSGGELAASTGCRELEGTYIEAEGKIATPELAARGECPADLAEQDSHVVEVFEGGFHVDVDGDTLRLTSGDLGLVYRAT